MRSFLRLVSLVPAFFAQSTYTDVGKACRYTSDISVRCSDPCAKFDNIVLPSTNDATVNTNLCQQICSARMECTGFEYGSVTRRCEIWKVPIMSATSSGSYVCMNYTGPAKTQDTEIYIGFDLEMSGLNISEIMDVMPTMPMLLAPGIKSGIVSSFSSMPDDAGGVAAGVENITADDIVPVFFDDMFKVHIKPSSTVNPLAVYQMLRGSNPDGIPDGRTPIQNLLTSTINSFPGISAYVIGTVATSITNRTIMFSEPPTPPPPPSTSSTSSGTTSSGTTSSGTTSSGTTSSGTTSSGTTSSGTGTQPKIADSAFQTGGFTLGFPVAMAVVLALSSL